MGQSKTNRKAGKTPKPPNIDRLVDDYMSEHHIAAAQIMAYRNRHLTSCPHYGTPSFSKCDCLARPKFALVAPSQSHGSALKIHEVVDPETGACARILEVLD
jgi:hypothetical protein